MNTSADPRTFKPADVRAAGIAGILGGVLVLVAPMIGPRIGAVIWLLGLALAVVTLAGLTEVLRDDRRPLNWLAPMIVPFGAVALTVQMTAMGVGFAANHVSKASPAHEPLHSVESALFSISLFGLGVALTAAAVALRGRPRTTSWITVATGAVGISLIANASVLGTEQLPALVGFIVWLPACGVALLRTGRPTQPEQERATRRLSHSRPAT
jgi:hypothetical protein